MKNSFSFKISDCIQIDGRQLSPMDSPFDILPGLKNASPMAESWHCHHTNPLVITGAELAGLSSRDVQSSPICHHKGRVPTQVSRLCSMALSGRLLRSSFRNRETIRLLEHTGKEKLFWPKSLTLQLKEAEPQRTKVEGIPHQGATSNFFLF